MTDQEWLRTMRLEALAYTNDILSDKDQIAIREVLMRATVDVSSLASDISRLQQTIANLEQRHAEGLSRIHRLRAGLAPHKRVPPEILSKIFLHCAGSPIKLPPHRDDPIWAVTHVCSRWRKVAMAEPLLWREVGARYNKKPDALNAMLHDIFSNRGGGRGAISYHAPLITSHKEWDDVLTLVSTYHSRILDLNASFFEFIPPSFDTPLSLFNNLGSIAISFSRFVRHDLKGIKIKAFSTAQNLRKASIHIPHDDPRLLFTWPPRISLPWGQLIQLNIDVVPISLFLMILEQCGPLVSCEVRLRDDIYPQKITEHPIELNYLRSLVICHNSTYSAVKRLLDCLVTPTLNSLKFREEEWEGWPKELVLNLISRSMCNLEILETPGRALVDEDLLPLMRAMSRLKVFSAFTRQPVSQETLEIIRSEKLAPELCWLDGWQVASLRSFVEFLRSRMTEGNGGVRNVRVWVPGDRFCLEMEYFKSILPELTKNGLEIKVFSCHYL